jgi:spore germination cell wall hydrolase CwlJ-like protein
LAPHSAFGAEPQPDEFSARIAREPRGHGIRQGRKQHGRRFAALALAIAVPAFAAPSEWQGFGPARQAQAPAVKPMGFEIPGESFPGSAFYYLADAPNLQPAAGSEAPGDFAAPAGTPAGPAARPLAITGSPTDKARALKCLTMAVYYEAAREPDAGQRAVAQVVMNRVAHPAFPDTVCGVVFEGSERSTGCQFTFTCDGSLDRKPVPAFWDRAQKVALAALDGAVYARVGLATHYHTLQVHPGWDARMADAATIGAHRFFRWIGPAGLPGAFAAAYAGHEPLPAPHPKSKAPAIPPPDPVELERSFEATLAAMPTAPAHAQRAVQGTGAANPPPSYAPAIEARGSDGQFTASRLPQAGDVRPEYAASGQWITHR